MTLDEAKKIIEDIKKDPSKGLKDAAMTAEAIRLVSGAAVKGG